jgi:hypothetical protein
MPWSALPEHINEPREWAGKDHDKVWYTRWVKYVQGWFAYGPRAKEWWARWRLVPCTLFAMKGNGPWRFEGIMRDGKVRFYRSRAQYWTRWHVALQWPLQLTFHWYWRAADVPTTDTRPQNLNIKKLVFGYGPVHRDADDVYWFPSFYLGGTWK